MTGRFTAVVRVDLRSEDVSVDVGGHVEPAALPELCEVIQRCSDITGRHVRVDVTGARLGSDTWQLLCDRCQGVATVTPSASGEPTAAWASPEPGQRGPVPEL